MPDGLPLPGVGEAGPSLRIFSRLISIDADHGLALSWASVVVVEREDPEDRAHLLAAGCLAVVNSNG